MNGQKILIIEDEDDIRELVCYNLEREGFTVSAVKSGEEGLRLANEEIPALIILDIMLPGMDGLDVCRNLKQRMQTARLPVIMMSARGEESDIVTGLELGAEDYVTKPFSPKILVARVKAVLRRRKEEPADQMAPVSVHDLRIDPGKFQVYAASNLVTLTATEFKILHHLARHPGWVFTRYQIVDAIRGEDYAVTDRAVDVQIVGLRKKLGDCGTYIETVRGVGYRFKE